MQLSSDNPTAYKILRLCKQPQPLIKVAKLIHCTKCEKSCKTICTAAYHRTYRLINKLISSNFLTKQKYNNKTFFVVTTPAGLDLLSSAANLKPRKDIHAAVPIRATIERKKAIQLLQSFKLLNTDLRAEIDNLFDEYIELCNQKVIILHLLNSENFSDLKNPEYLILKYLTRFTDNTRKKQSIEQYERIFESIPPQYKKAVHLVLTTNPKLFRNLYEANRHFVIALNRFFSRLRKIFRERPLYIAVYEFTKTGLLHAHIILFGRPFLLPKRKITQIWQACGQGSYNYVYSLKRTSSGWVYARERPKKLKKGTTADDYLKKYLLKAQYDENSMSMYWATNKRFYSFSLRLKTWKTPKKPATSLYKFFMSCFEWDIPYAVLSDTYYNKIPIG
jgi:hypothetical protein